MFFIPHFSRSCPASAVFLLREREFLAYFGYFVADLCTFWRKFTGLNIAVVP